MAIETKLPKNVMPEPARPVEEAEIRKNAAEDEKDALETLEFLQAVDEYKRKTGKAFPTWTEILEILKSLGYRKS
jgi:hypothetical protein